MTTDSPNGYVRETAYWLATLSQLAYQDERTIQETVDTLGLNGFFQFVAGPHTDTQGFVAGNATDIVVAFRGTQSHDPIDWLTDARAELVDHVHEGFHDALGEVWPQVTTAIDQAKGERQSLIDLANATDPIQEAVPSVWMTGHSLGGALAALATARIVESQHPVAGLYTFGQPRVGDLTWARAFDHSFKSRDFRLVNNADVVPRVPPRTLHYAHAGTLCYIDAAGKMHLDEGVWQRLLDRYQGTVADIEKLQWADIADHAIAQYLNHLGPRPKALRLT